MVQMIALIDFGCVEGDFKKGDVFIVDSDERCKSLEFTGHAQKHVQENVLEKEYMTSKEIKKEFGVHWKKLNKWKSDGVVDYKYDKDTVLFNKKDVKKCLSVQK